MAAPRFLAGEIPSRRLVRPQARFDGSRRQARGAVVRLLSAAGSKAVPQKTVAAALERGDADEIIASLVRDGLVVRKKGKLALP